MWKTAVLAILVLAWVGSAKLVVYSPVELKTKLGNGGEVVASIADFGHIPYGHTLVGQAVYIQTNDNGCSSFGDALSKFDDPSPIVLVKRGGCSFVQKVRNVEHGGGKMAIVVDEANNENVKFIAMVNDGTGNGIVIPSLLINKDPGNQILDFFTVNDASVTKKVKIVVSFDIAHPDNRVEYDILLSSYQDRALDFISSFKEYHDKLGKDALMTPRYFSWPWFSWDEDIKAKDCFGHGKYWAIDYENLDMSGRTILLSNIHQKWIYKLSMANKGDDSDWWAYVKSAHSTCYKDFTEECSKMIHERLKLDYAKTLDCVNKSFTNKDTADEDNSILGEDYEYWNEEGFIYTPAVYINDVKYQGDLVASYVFEAICSGFMTKPAECKGGASTPTDESKSSSSKHVSFNWFLIVVIALIVLNIVLILICIKINKTKLKEHVFDAIGQHKNLSSSGKEVGAQKFQKFKDSKYESET